MSCDRIQERLSAYLDGDLAADEHREVETHLRTCVPCRRLYRDLQELNGRIRDWDPEVTPRRDLWPQVAARIERDRSPAAPPPAGRPLRRWALAAAAALAVGLEVPIAVDRFADREPSAEVQARRERDQLAYEELVAAASLARAADGTLQPRRDLESMLAAHRGRLDADTVAALEVEVERLERAIGEIYLALAEHPEDRQLRLQLAARYRQETDLLQRIGRV